MQETEHEKAKIRDDALQRRRDLTETQRRIAADEVCERLRDWEVTRQPRPIGGYVAFDSEVDITTFLDDKIEQGAEVALPRVDDGATMEFVPVDSLEELEPGAFGIMEPSGDPIAIDEVTVFLVPGAAFDAQGHRIGMGRGYYDRALARRLEADGTEPIFVGVCYDCQFFDEELPVEGHDVSVHAVVTPSDIVRCQSIPG
ncbi:MAG: 5-formyltetrahydrofolate cyclo-ligase [Bradymonadaceae bacterium]